jgi:hypothetical protein
MTVFVPCNVISGIMMTVFVRLFHPYFVFLLITILLGNKILNVPNNIKMTKMPRCSIDKQKYHSKAG